MVAPHVPAPMRVGVDLGGTKIEAVLLDDAGREVFRERDATPAGDYEGTLAAVAALVARARRHAGGPVTIGVGTPGSASLDTGLMRNANSTVLNGRPLQRDLERALGQPVRIANDANCFAMSEASDGAGAGAPVVFGVILGTGVGGGLVVHGRLLGGVNGIAGEWGHIALPPSDRDAEPPGRACYCGRTGCVETWLCGPALARSYRDLSGRQATVPDIVRLAGSDPAAAQAMDAYVARLARALAVVINIVDPDVIVLGGGLSAIDRLYDEVPARWPRHVFSDSVRTRLVRNRHGDSSGVRGAAWLWSAPAGATPA